MTTFDRIEDAETGDQSSEPGLAYLLSLRRVASPRGAVDTMSKRKAGSDESTGDSMDQTNGNGWLVFSIAYETVACAGRWPCIRPKANL